MYQLCGADQTYCILTTDVKQKLEGKRKSINFNKQLASTPIYVHLGGEGHYEGKLSSPGTQNSDTDQGLFPKLLIQSAIF